MPFLLQAGRTTKAGFLQSLTLLRGFPLLIDETHIANHEMIMNVVYQFANKQSYAKGGKDGSVQGGEALQGVVYMSGEAPPQFQHLGERNRALVINSYQHPPLGSLNTPERSNLLVQAMQDGAGAWGHELAEVVWEKREQIYQEILKAEDSFPEANEWSRALCAAQVGLALLIEVMDIEMALMPCNLTSEAVRALGESRKDNDPVFEAFEAIRTVVLNSTPDPDTPNSVNRYGERFAVLENDTWYVFPSTKVIREVLEPFGGFKGNGVEWVRRGWCAGDQTGRGTVKKRLGKTIFRCMAISNTIMREGVCLINQNIILDCTTLRQKSYAFFMWYTMWYTL